ESMDQQTLDYYNKQSTPAANARALHALARAGIDAIAGLIIGAPHDTVDSILDNADAYLELPMYGISVSVLTPDPGTAEFHRARRRGGDLGDALGGPNNAFRVMPDVSRFGPETPVGLPSVCTSVGKKDLNVLATMIETEFYFRAPVLAKLLAGRSEWQVQRTH